LVSLPSPLSAPLLTVFGDFIFSLVEGSDSSYFLGIPNLSCGLYSFFIFLFLLSVLASV